MAKLTLEQIQKDTIWVAKMQTGRIVGTWAEVEHLADSDDCRDCDICAEQPEHLKAFYDEYLKYTREHGWMIIPDYYHTVYEKQTEQAKRVWTQEEIKNLVQTNDKVLYGALKNLYAQQTADEQDSGETREHNGRGFNGVDAQFLTSVAQFLERTGFLTDKQKVVTRKKLVKYTKQLTMLANA